MSFSVYCRTCRPVSPEEERAIRSAAEAFNRGRTWVLAFDRDESTGQLVCRMKSTGPPEFSPATGRVLEWPGAYEAQCLLEGLCAIAREQAIDWEIHNPYSVRPVGFIRNGVCLNDPEGHAESLRRMGEKYWGEKNG